MGTKSQIKMGAMLSYVSIALNIISGLLYTPWMVETIGKSQYGLYTLATSLITLFLVDFGLSSATSRYLSKYNAEGDRESAERFLGATYKLYLTIDAVIIVILIVIYFLLDKIYIKLTPEEMEQFKVVYLISAVFSVINFPCVTFKGILNAYEKFVPLKMADLLYRVFLVGFTVVALLLGYGLYAMVSVHALVGLLKLLYEFIVIKKTVPLKVRFKKTDKGLYKEIFSYSLWVTVLSLATLLVINITPSILGMVANSTDIAVFGIVTTLEGYTYTITTAINGMFMPRISKILTKNDGETQLNRLFLSVGKFQFVLNGLIVVGIAVVGNSFIQLWMGNGYEMAYYGAVLVILPGLFFNPLQIANTTLAVTRKVKHAALVNLLMGVLNVVLSLPLSKNFGVIGACISICIARFVRVILLNILCHKILPLNIPKFIKRCYLPMSIPVVLTLAVGLAINHLVPDSGWLTFLIKGTAVVIVYAVLVLVIGLRKSERKNLLEMFKKFMHLKKDV
ncbi:MAG: oligosaccharide flippase family protein [Oscillospiraceae bacterium]|nr:oligosaccharide flippase family protein [Oscillospiraceae bacterium]